MQTTLGVSNVSFGLKPAARAVLNSVFLDECVQAGLDSAIVHAARIMPIARIDEGQREVALDLVYDRRRRGLRPAVPAARAVRGRGRGRSRPAGPRHWPVERRPRAADHRRRAQRPRGRPRRGAGRRPALEIVNDVLLDGMKTVGELFGSGQMQLPFVLQSAEVMKPPCLPGAAHGAADEDGKGRIVLATVKGDVHDIGKNLVDIILTNNGYDVVNIGIKQPVAAIVAAAEEHEADVIGMSGLLVKSTVVMRDNLAELNGRGLSQSRAARRRRAHPRLRGAGPGQVFEGRGPLRQGRLRGAPHHGPSGGADPARARTIPPSAAETRGPGACPRKSQIDAVSVADRPSRSPEVAKDNPVFTPPSSWAAGWPRGSPSTTSPPIST